MIRLFIIAFIVSLTTAQTCRIHLIDIKRKDKVCSQLNLIRGRIKCIKQDGPYTNDLKRFITSHVLNFKLNWPVNTYNQFKVLVYLKNGINKISLIYSYKTENAKLEIELNYVDNSDLDPLRLGLFIAKDSILKFDMDKESLALGDKNGLASAIKRVQTAALFAQALTSDSLNHHEYGRRTFRLELNRKNLPNVNIFRSEMTRQELAHKYLYDENFVLFNHIHDIIRKSQIYNNETKYSRNRMIFGIIVLDTYYENRLNRTILHAAVGSGNYQPRLGILSSHLLHAWPETWRQINRFFDERYLDFNQLADDFSQTKMEALNTGIGAFIHEIGHAYALGHSGLGIMSRNWSINKFFLSVYKKNGKFYPVRHYIDEENTGWKKSDALCLAKHYYIMGSLNAFKRSGNYKWKVNNSSSYFLKISKKTWFEMSDYEAKYEYNFVQENNNTVVLYAIDRKIYISLDSQFVKFGLSRDQINTVIYYGDWFKQV